MIPLTSKTPLLSAGDLSLRYGKSRAYWSELMVGEKLKSVQTNAGRVTHPKWVEEFLKARPRSN